MTKVSNCDVIFGKQHSWEGVMEDHAVNGILLSARELEDMRILKGLQVFALLDLARKLAENVNEYWKNLIDKSLQLAIITLVPRRAMDLENVRLGVDEYIFHDDSYFELVHFWQSGSAEEFISGTRRNREKSMDLLRELFLRLGKKTVFVRDQLSHEDPDVQQAVTAFGVIQGIVVPAFRLCEGIPIKQNHFRFTPSATHLLLSPRGP